MKKQRGVNPDYADFDEIDEDVEDAIEGYDNGTVTADELKVMMGTDAARTIIERRESGDPFSLFDDPEEL